LRIGSLARPGIGPAIRRALLISARRAILRSGIPAPLALLTAALRGIGAIGRPLLARITALRRAGRLGGLLQRLILRRVENAFHRLEEILPRLLLFAAKFLHDRLGLLPLIIAQAKLIERAADAGRAGRTTFAAGLRIALATIIRASRIARAEIVGTAGIGWLARAGIARVT
jgi:hypothetical protein